MYRGNKSISQCSGLSYVGETFSHAPGKFDLFTIRMALIRRQTVRYVQVAAP